MQRAVPAAYESDFALWVEDQAAALRAGRFGDVDIANVTDELEALVSSNRREIGRRLTLIAMHLLKQHHQPEKESPSWRNTIRLQAREVEKILADSPSLRRKMPTFIAKAYADARDDASGETGLPLAVFPEIPTPEFERAMAVALTGRGPA